MAPKRFAPYTTKKEEAKRPAQDEEPQLPSSNTVDTERTPRLPYRQLGTLMMNTVLPLNASCSKEIVIGLNGEDQSFSPEIQIVRRSGSNRYGITLSPSEWNEIMEYSSDITQYFYVDDCNKSRKPIRLQTIVLSFQIVYGNTTLVICKPWPTVSSHIGVYQPDNIAIQKPSWDTLMVSRRCITQAILDSSALTEQAKTQFDIISRAAMDHLRVATNLDSTSSDEDIQKPLIVFLNNLEISGLTSINPNLHLLCYNICLRCIPVFISRFKLVSFYSS